MTSSKALPELASKVASSSISGLDRLRVGHSPLAPEIRLHLAEDAIVLWARLEAETGTSMAAPYWASAWVGGQALARYVLDNPEVAAGKRVLDLASGSGLVALAAAKAGAATVTANDIDPYALTAIAMNAELNGVEITGHLGDLLDLDTSGFDLVLAGDVLYNAAIADTVFPFLRQASRQGAQVLIGDPGRGHLPNAGLDILATYRTTATGADCDAQITGVHVLSMAQAGHIGGGRLQK